MCLRFGVCPVTHSWAVPTSPVPTPPPVPITPAPAPPTIVVHVDAPPSVHSFTDWLYASGASLIGAFIAICAAGVAYLAIKKQIDAENLRRTHEVRTSLVNDASALADEIMSWATTPGHYKSPESTAIAQSLRPRVIAMTNSFRLFGMVEESNYFPDFYANAVKRAAASPGAPDWAQWEQMYNDLFKMLQNSIPNLD